MSKKQSNYKSSVFLRNYGGAKNGFFCFWLFLTKKTGHRVTKFHPVYRINITYKFYFMIFSLIQKNKLSYIYIYASLRSLLREGWDGVVGRAVVSGFENPGSSPTAVNLFFSFKILRICGRLSFLPKNSAFAEDGSFFAKKKLRIFLNIYYINCRCDRRFT